MPRPIEKLPRYVELKPSRAGTPRWYFRRSREELRQRLPGTPYSPEFMVSYAALISGGTLPSMPHGGLSAVRKASRGKLGWLITLYLQSAAFLRLKESTRAVRGRLFKKLIEEKGDIDIEDIDRSVIDAAVKARAATPDGANFFKQAVSKLFDWAMEEVLPGATAPICSDNPCTGVKRLVRPRPADPDEETGYATWDDEDLAQFEAAYPHGTRERLAYEVMLCTGLRVSDACRVGRQHVKNGVIRIKTVKTNTWVTLDVVPRLAKALELGPHGRPEVLAFITGVRGAQMEANHLGGWFGEQCRKIGLDHSGHGLRKAAARRYAEAGKTANELMAIFGWKGIEMAQKYTAAFDRAKTSVNAMRGTVLDKEFAA